MYGNKTGVYVDPNDVQRAIRSCNVSPKLDHYFFVTGRWRRGRRERQERRGQMGCDDSLQRGFVRGMAVERVASMCARNRRF